MQKALITAGGRATRLRPISHTLNKHLIPLANKPMLFYVIEKVIDAGIRDIAINVNPGEEELQRFVGDGSRWGARIQYIEQTGGPQGLAHIIRNAEPILGREPFLFVLGDNLILGDLRSLIEKFERESLDMCLAFVRVREPQRFGVGEFRDGRLVRVLEKPVDPPSDLAQTGIYLYSPAIFDAVRAIPRSARGEFEISDANTHLIEQGKRVGWVEFTGWWKDTGKPEDLLEGNQLILATHAFDGDRHDAVIEDGAIIQGKVQVGVGSRIGSGVLIRGPVIIGERCVIEQSYIGPYTSIGNDVKVMNTEIEHSIVFDSAAIDVHGRIVDSIIGHHAAVASANSKLPYGRKLIVGDHTIVEM